ncbi:MAG TPA: serine/threonine-protein kinase [Kofleriaceae bacterium]|nr:serine/threonine-protein kinase [Kofleriaceae bacterium]
MKRRRQTSRTIPDHASRRIEDAGLDAYGVIGEIARGGMSTIYLGEDRATGERVAIKALDAFHVGHSDLVHRLLAEHELARRARHPGLIDIRCADQTAHGVPYLVMEYLDGESLRELCDRRALSRDAILDIVAQVACALAALHAAGVVHCDVKPDNVFVLCDPDAGGAPRVKVIDFGVARSVHDAGHDGAEAVPGAIAGTPAFMAPEQWYGAPVPASDVYALGALLYELVTGRPVFSGSLPQLMTAHCEQLPVRPAALCGDLRPELDRLIMRMLAKDPALRPTMAAIDAELSQQVAMDLPVQAAAG